MVMVLSGTHEVNEYVTKTGVLFQGKAVTDTGRRYKPPVVLLKWTCSQTFIC